MCNYEGMEKHAAHHLLSAYLTSKGISQKSFADMLSIDRSVVSRFLSGKVKPSLDTAFAIERATKGKVKAWAWVSDSEARQ